MNTSDAPELKRQTFTQHSTFPQLQAHLVAGERLESSALTGIKHQLESSSVPIS